jgi:MarR family transcriptional regulator, temperature-dependent positive regulator of motility
MKTETAAQAGTMNLLTRLSRVIYRRAVPELIGIKIKEFVALVYLRESGRATQQKLAETMMMDANNCVILLNGLEDVGLIARNRDPDDRRRHIVEITPKGHRALEKAERALETLEDEVLDNLDDSERDQLRDLLAKALKDHSLAISA